MKKLIITAVLSVVIIGCDAQKGFEKASEITAKGESYAETIGMIPATQPYAAGTSAVLVGLTIIFGGLSAWLKKKNKDQDKALKTVLKAVDPLPDVGKTITAATIENRVADLVEKAYIES